MRTAANFEEVAVFDFESTTKTCTKCGIDKPISDFTKDRRNPDGHGPRCKQCWNSFCRQKYARNKDAIRKRRRAYNYKPEYVAAYKAKYNRTHREENAARAFVNRAVRVGQLPHISTQMCIRCGNQARDYHHRKGYLMKHWLDVVPVCGPCHGFLDSHQ